MVIPVDPRDVVSFWLKRQLWNTWAVLKDVNLPIILVWVRSHPSIITRSLDPRPVASIVSICVLIELTRICLDMNGILELFDNGPSSRMVIAGIYGTFSITNDVPRAGVINVNGNADVVWLTMHHRQVDVTFSPVPPGLGCAS